jgi:hypothetical protein
MDTNSDARETAERALRRLLELQSSVSPSIADVAAVASEVRVPPGSELSPAAANTARAEAWLAIRKVVRTLEGNNPTNSELTAFWRRAIDMVKLWLEAIEAGS